MKKFKLTEFQNKLLGWTLDGAEIQVTQTGDKVQYDVCFENGDSESIKAKSFEALKNQGLIKRKYNPSIDAERWA